MIKIKIFNPVAGKKGETKLKACVSPIGMLFELCEERLG